MLRRLGIRGKVLAALSVPVLVLFLLAGALSLQSIEQARAARTATSLLTVIQESRDLVVNLQAERRASMAYVNGDDVMQPEVQSSREVVAEAFDRMERAAGRVDFGALDPHVSTELEWVLGTRTRLEAIRGRVDARSVPMTPILNDFSRVIDDVVDFPRQAADALPDRRLGAIVSAHSLVTSMVDDYSQEQALGAEILGGARGQEEFLRLAALFPASKIAQDEATEAVAALGLADDVVVPPLGASFQGFQSYDSYRTLVATGQTQNLNFIAVEDWTAFAGEEIDAFDAVQSDLSQAALARANEVAGAQLRTAVLTILVSLAAIVLSIMAAMGVAGRIINPLRRLTEAAAAVRDELPRLVEQVAIPGQGPDLSLTRIPVDSKDEVGQLAAAFNEVNATTIEVAQEQAALRASIAEMFVNVARRDQVLLDRQLSFIDALERSEEDPKTLADLFRLDHLATRMRRNAESLLVLAGIDTGRRLREPLPSSDVIRTASSEIEHYERIQLDLPVDPYMLGHTALPAAHLLAELLENATVFSDPGTPVQVSTGIDDDDVIITILDRGLGMTADELAEANARIRAVSAGDVLGAQRLGLYVVGRIAARLGAGVELATGSNGTGTLATVRMPRLLFVEAQSIPLMPTGAAMQPETFVLPEQAATIAHDGAYARVPDEVRDVPVGAVGSAELPAEEIDLTALVDGTTQTGLPRRRGGADRAPAAPSSQTREDDDAAAPSIPLAPSPDALASAAQDAEEVWTPPVVQGSGPLNVRRTGEPAPELPQPLPIPAQVEEPAPVPVREPAPVPEPPAIAAPAPHAGSGSGVGSRGAMFAGFRSRRAELAAASIQDAAGPLEPEIVLGGADGAERLAAAAAGAPAYRYGGTPPAGSDMPRAEDIDDEPETFVIPALVEDEDEYGDAAFAPDAPEPGPFAEADLAFAGESDQPWSPEHTAWPAQERRVRPAQPVAWSQPQAEGQPQPQQPAAAWPQPQPAAWPSDEAWPPAQPGAWQPVATPQWPPQDAPEAMPSAQVEPVADAQVEPVAEAERPAAAEHFSDRVTGPTRRSIRQPNRRQWFRRARAEVAAATETETVAVVPDGPAAVVHPVAATVTEPDGEPVSPPVRLSAWATAEAGSHVLPEPLVSAEPWDGPVAPVAPVEEGSHSPEPVSVTEPAPAPVPDLPPRPPIPPVVQQWEPGPEYMPEPVAWSRAVEPELIPDEPVEVFTPEPAPVAAPEPAVYGGTMFTPQTDGAFDDEMTNMFAQRADLAQQALAELNQLSTYRPKAVTAGASTLTRRTPGTIPAAPAIATRHGVERPVRDADQVRSLLSSFQSGTARGRQSAEDEPGSTSDVRAADGEKGTNRHAGHEGGPDAVDGDSVTTPESDLTPRSTSW